MKIVDTHTHLSCDDFNEDREQALARALEVCDYLIDIGAGTEENSHERAKDFSEKHESVYFTAGVHPHDAETLGQKSGHLDQIKQLLDHEKCVAVGECGLDYFYDHSPREAQKKVFEKHIEWAIDKNIPLMIHTREAEEDTKQMLADFNGKTVFHCFTGSQDLADFAISKNFWISFSGIVTFKKAQELRDTFMTIPLNQILIETDAPYLAPVPNRGKRNEPSFIQHTASFLANLRGMSTEEFIQRTHQNSLEIFSKINSAK